MNATDLMSKPDSTLVLPAIVGIEAGRPADVEAEVLALFDECGAPLLRYVGSFGVGAPDTEDIVQDVFLSLFCHVQGGKPRSNLRGWIFRVAHNLALKQRARARKRHVNEDVDVELAASRIDSATNPEEQLASHQRRQRLLAVYRALPERDRRCLSLRAEGLRYREIAGALGISLGAVAKSLTRSMTRMVNADER
jgi:RNA polymerase sigma-70 factor (ECF subfamily)